MVVLNFQKILHNQCKETALKLNAKAYCLHSGGEYFSRDKSLICSNNNHMEDAARKPLNLKQKSI